MSLKHKTFSAVRWTTLASVARTIVQLAQVSILARLLKPEDYGLMAMVGVVLSFAALFTDLGLNSAYIQKQDVTLEQRSSLFWLNFAMGVGLTLLVIVISPLLAWFFGDSRLTPLLMLSSLTFIITSAGQQVRMTAEKNLNFRPVVITEIVAAVFGLLIAVSAALADFGVYSLILGSITTAFAATLLGWIVIAQGWRPYWQFRFTDVKPYIRFGGAVVADAVFNNINRSIDLLLGGRLLAAPQLGLYSVPRNLILQIQFMVNPIITRVGFPLIAQVQHDIPRVRLIYLNTLNMTASVNAPLYMGLAFFAPDAVHVLLGNKWTGSVDFLRILAIWGFLRSTGNPIGSLLMGMGRAGLAMKWNFTLLFIISPALWVGSYIGGAEGLAWAMLITMSVILIPGWYILIRPLCQASLFEYLSATFKPLLIAIGSVGAVYLICRHIELPLLRLATGIALSVPLYWIISYKYNRDWIDSMLNLIKIRSL
ncbi:Colanic acid exporter [Candidatus Electronema halotolerans]